MKFTPIFSITSGFYSISFVHLMILMDADRKIEKGEKK